MKKIICASIIMILGMSLLVVGEDEKTPANKNKTCRIAVLDFQNKSGNDKLTPYAHALSRTLASDLFLANGIEMLERNEVEKALDEKKMRKDGVLSPEAMAEAKQALGVDYLIEGSITLQQNILSLSYCIYSFSQNKIILQETIEADPVELLQTVEKLKKKIVHEVQPQPVEVKKGKVSGMIKLAVMPFEDLSPEGRMSALAEMVQYNIESKLSEAKSLNVLDREYLNEILTEQKLSLSALTEQSNAVKIGKIAGLNYLVFGTIIFIENKLRVDVRIVDVETGKIQIQTQSSDNVEKLDSIIGNIGKDIFDKANVNPIAVQEDKFQSQAIKEAAFHLERATKTAHETRMIIYPDEEKSLQRAMYLDTLDNAAELVLVDQLIDSGMYKDAERKIRLMLKKDLPEKTQAFLWMRLAKTYKVKSALPIFFHIIKKYPDTTEALESHWYIMIHFSGGELFVPYDIPFVYNSAIILDKNRPRLDEFVSKVETNPHIQGDPGNANSVLDWRLKYVKSMMGLVDLPNLDADQIYNKMGETYPGKQIPIQKQEFVEYIDLLKKGELLTALDKLDTMSGKSNGFSPIFTEYIRLENYLDYKRDYDTMLKVIKAKENRKYRNADMLNRAVQIIEQKKQLLQVCDYEKYVLPEFPSDREPGLSLELALLSDWSAKANEVVKANPTTPEKACQEMMLGKYRTEFFDERNSPYGDKSGKALKKLNKKQICLSVLIAAYMRQNRSKIALRILNEMVDGGTLSEKVNNLHGCAIRYLAGYYAKHMDYEKAIELYKNFDNNALMEIYLFKLQDFEKLRPYLDERTGPRRYFNLRMRRGPKVTTPRSMNIEKRSFNLDYPVYITALYYLQTGQQKKAFDHFVRYMNSVVSWMPTHDEALHAKCLEHIRDLENILIPETQKNLCWKVGLWWEGVQCWYLNKPENSNLEEGFVFTPLYFEVGGTRDVYGPIEYVLNIYNCTREQYLAENDKSKLLYATLYVEAATLYINTPEGGPALSNLSPFGNDKGISHFNVAEESGWSLLPVADHNIAREAPVFMSSPFFTYLSDSLKCKINKSMDEISVKGEKVECSKYDLTMDKDIFQLSDCLTVGCAEIFADKKLAESPYLLEEWWSNKYPWWLRVAEKNKWYKDGVSPANAIYSKLFVLTNVNGNEIKVNTGLPGELSDIKVLKEKYKNYEQTTPFKNVPDRDLIEKLDIMYKAQRAPSAINTIFSIPIVNKLYHIIAQQRIN